MSLEVSFLTRHDKVLKKGCPLSVTYKTKRELKSSTHSGVLSVKSSLRLKSSW